MRIDKIIEKTEAIYPYKVRGRRDTYDRYNEGWSDACDIIRTQISKQLKLEASEKTITIKAQVQMCKRTRWQIYKKGWHKHTDFFGKKWWIRYNWNQ